MVHKLINLRMILQIYNRWISLWRRKKLPLRCSVVFHKHLIILKMSRIGRGMRCKERMVKLVGLIILEGKDLNQLKWHLRKVFWGEFWTVCILNNKKISSSCKVVIRNHNLSAMIMILNNVDFEITMHTKIIILCNISTQLW